MAYGTIKVDTITFTDDGSDVSVSVSGLAKNPTISGDLTVTGNISGTVIQGGTTVSGATVTGTTANFVSGVYTTQLSGATITGDAGQFTTLTGGTAGFTTVTGTTVTGTTANFVSGVFTTQVSGATVTGDTGEFTTLTGGTAGFTTITGTTVTGTTANFVTVSGTTVTGNAGNFTTATVTSGVFASGTAGAPSVSVGTTDNGLYSPGTDQVAISTNGTGRLFVDASGRVGLGVASPVTPLHVRASNSTVRATAASTDFTAFEAAIDSGATCRIGAYVGSNGFVGTTTNHPVVFETNSAERLRITSAGLVGIGTSSPSAKLTVIGLTNESNVIRVSDNSTYTFELGRSKDNAGNFGYIGGTGGTGLTLGANNTEAVRIDTSGRVGIGSTSPALKLHAEDSSSQIIRWQRTSVGAGSLDIDANGNAVINAHTVSTGIAFHLQTNEAARIDSSGRLLVGTSSSATGTSSQYAKFQVIGNNTAATNRGAIVNLGHSAGSLGISNGVLIGGILFTDNAAGEYASIDCFGDGQAGSGDYPGRLVFRVTADGASSPTEALRISNDRSITVSDGGNIVVGTTTGTKIGTATSQKIGFFDATPVVQPTTGVAEAAFVENSGGTAVNVDSTFGGYTLQQVVQALQNLGILA